MLMPLVKEKRFNDQIAHIWNDFVLNNKLCLMVFLQKRYIIHSDFLKAQQMKNFVSLNM